MERKEWTKEENKIAALLYTNDQVNDQLALEIIKNWNKPLGNLFAPVLSVAMKASIPSIKQELIQVLDKYLNKIQKKHLQEFTTGYDSFFIKDNYSKKIAAEIYFTAFLRDKDMSRIFLKTASDYHPGRAKAFKAFLDFRIQYGSGSGIEINMFTKQELITYLSHPKVNFSTQTMIIENEILDDLPKKIYQLDFKRLYLKKCIGEKLFEFVFSFPNLTFLQIEEMKLDHIPKDWKEFQNLKDLNLFSDSHCFKNLDFLDTIPNLKNFSIGNNEATNPNIFLNKKKLILYHEPSLEAFGSFCVNGHGNVFKMPWKKVINFSSAIRKSNLFFIIQEHYYEMITKLDNLTNLPELHIHELADLLTINYYELNQVCFNRLNKIAEDSNGINTLMADQSLIWILGKLSTKKMNLTIDLEKLNIKSTFKFLPNVTHVVIGKNPKNYRELRNLDFDLISEKQLLQFITKRNNRNL